MHINFSGSATGGTLGMEALSPNHAHPLRIESKFSWSVKDAPVVSSAPLKIDK